MILHQNKDATKLHHTFSLAFLFQQVLTRSKISLGPDGQKACYVTLACSLPPLENSITPTVFLLGWLAYWHLTLDL